MLRTAMTLLRFLVGVTLFCRSVSLAEGSPSNATSYDFIVVGGGTAGNAVATRLSQYLPDSSILVIEAGPFAPYEDRINIPGLKGSTLGTEYDWNFTSIPQPALYNRTITQSRGKVLGGTSALNLLIWDQASKAEYDSWGELGNPGWNWDSMIAAMTKAVNFTNPGPPVYTETTGYGTAGPINAVVNRYIPAQQHPWVPTLENLHVDHNTFWLAGENVGVAYQSSSIDPTHYNRSYSALAYLPKAGPNLHVRTNTEVAKINLVKTKSNNGFHATHVILLSGEVIRAKKEVIISGGTIKTPQLLELSGIGGADVLRDVGIQQLIDLPGVGENLQDHPRIQLSYQLRDNYTSFDKLKIDPAYALQQLTLWQAGELSAYDYTASAFSYQGWPSILGNECTPLFDAAKRVAATLDNIIDNKKLQWLTNPIYQNSIAQTEFVLSDGYTGNKGYPAKGSALYGKGFTTIIAGLMHQLARGSVHINTTDVSAKPVYDPNFASNEYDLKGLIAVAKYIRTIATTAPFSDVWTSEYDPGLHVQTDAQWQSYVRNNTNTFYHPVGTCAMLPRKDGGVVSPELKVYGTSNLRVVDASIIPLLVSAHPQTGIYGIAERAAEIIADCWR